MKFNNTDLRISVMVTLLLIVLINSVEAQKTITGQLLETSSESPVMFAHVVNTNLQKGTISDKNGMFLLEANLGDTLLLSCIGYKRRVISVKPYEGGVVLFRMEKDTMLLEEVHVYRFPSEGSFKKSILENHIEDKSFRYYGQPDINPKVDPTLSEDYMSNPLAILTNPLSYFYYNFSSYEKELRKYHKIKQKEVEEKKAQQKYNRTFLKEITGLCGDELTDFIAFCNFSTGYINKTPEYILRERIVLEYKDFRSHEVSAKLSTTNRRREP